MDWYQSGYTPYYDSFYFFIPLALLYLHYLFHRYNDFFFLPEEVQEQVNAHDHEFHSYAEMQAYIRDLMRRA